MIDHQLQRCHWRVEVHSAEVLHDENLTVTLSSVTGLGSLGGFPDLDDDDVTIERDE